jgi:hypothetical protein
VTLCTQLLQQPAAAIFVADERIATQEKLHYVTVAGQIIRILTLIL